MSLIQKVDVLGLTEKDMHTTRVTLMDQAIEPSQKELKKIKTLT